MVEDLKLKKNKVRVIELEPLIMWRVMQLGKLCEKKCLDDRVILGYVSYQFGIIRALKVDVLGNLEPFP